jgi:hypothetical protein
MDCRKATDLGQENKMGNKQAQRRTSARRAATFLAALGALVMSSGAALMVTATPANAADSVTFCHSTESESNPWELITTDDAAFYNGHVAQQHTADVYPAVTVHIGQQTIQVPAQGDQSFIDNGCSDTPPPPATCPEGTDNAGDPIPKGQTAEEYCNDQAPATCPEDSTANAGLEIPEGQTAEEFCNAVEQNLCPAGTDKVGQEIPAGDTEATFCNVVEQNLCPAGTDKVGQEIPAGDTEATFCTTTAVVSTPTQVVVSPPKAKTPTKAHAATVTPTLVEAGLTGTTQDLRGEQGLALMVAGMVMLAAAGGLGLRVRGAAARR